MTINIITLIDMTNTLENLVGSFIDAWMFNTTPLPSKLNTATPKKKGILEGVRILRSECKLGCSLMVFSSYVKITIKEVMMVILAIKDTYAMYLNVFSQQIGIKINAPIMM